MKSLLDLPQTVAAQDLLLELKRRRFVVPASQIQREISLVASGIDQLDDVCKGGLPRGAITEFQVSFGGSATVLYSLLAAATQRQEMTALIDPGDGFDLASAAIVGVDLRRLLWVRARSVKEALRATELVLDAGGFGLVALDLSFTERRKNKVLPAAAWMRIKKRASLCGALAVVFSATKTVGTFASLSVAVRQGRARWGGRLAQERWLDGVELFFELNRKRYG